MISKDDLSEFTVELAKDTKDMPALFLSLDIDEEEFMSWSHDGAQAAMAEVTIAMLSRDVVAVEKAIHATLISYFMVGFKAGAAFG